VVATALAQSSSSSTARAEKPLTDWEAADQCFVNLKKIGNAAHAYAAAHNDALPSDFASFKGYLTSPNLLVCPVAESELFPGLLFKRRVCRMAPGIASDGTTRAITPVLANFTPFGELRFFGRE
jgi:hypothetical protein